MREVLCKKYSNYSYDIISLLAGHLDRSDAVFTVLFSRSLSLLIELTLNRGKQGFISALDAMLRDPTLSGKLPLYLYGMVFTLSYSSDAASSLASMSPHHLSCRPILSSGLLPP